MTTTEPRARLHAPRLGGRAVTISGHRGGPTIGELILAVSAEHPTWQPVHRAIRSTTPAWCGRCDRPCRLPFGPGEDLCQPCRDGELADELARRGYVRVGSRQ